MIDFALISASFLSLTGIVYMVSRKVPFLLTIPENIIDESFVTKPSKLKVLVDRVREYIAGKQYEEPILSFLGWWLWKLRIALLRLEHKSFAVLKRIQDRRQLLKIPKGRRQYLESLKEEEGDNR